MFVFLNSTLQVLQKISLLNNILNNKKYFYGRNIDHKSISVREYMVYYLLLPQQIIFIYKIFQLAEQNMYLQLTYKYPMLCTYVLHKRHGQFFGANSRIFFFNSVGNTIFFNSAG